MWIPVRDLAPVRRDDREDRHDRQQHGREGSWDRLGLEDQLGRGRAGLGQHDREEDQDADRPDVTSTWAAATSGAPTMT